MAHASFDRKTNFIDYQLEKERELDEEIRRQEAERKREENHLRTARRQEEDRKAKEAEREDRSLRRRMALAFWILFMTMLYILSKL